MGDIALDNANWIALGACILALAAAGGFGWRAWRAFRRVQLTSEVALQLLDVHRDRVDDALVLAGERSGIVADHGELLATQIATLRENTTHLHWLLGRIPEERERLRREVLDALLPTRERQSDEHQDARNA